MTGPTIDDLDPTHALSPEVRDIVKVFLEVSVEVGGTEKEVETWFGERGIDGDSIKLALRAFADMNYEDNVKGQNIPVQTVLRVGLTMGCMYGFALCEDRFEFMRGVQK